MVLDGHAAEAALIENPVETGGVELLAIEDVHRGFNQVFLKTGWHAQARVRASEFLPHTRHRTTLVLRWRRPHDELRRRGCGVGMLCGSKLWEF